MFHLLFSELVNILAKTLDACQAPEYRSVVDYLARLEKEVRCLANKNGKNTACLHSCSSLDLGCRTKHPKPRTYLQGQLDRVLITAEAGQILVVSARHDGMTNWCSHIRKRE